MKKLVGPAFLGLVCSFAGMAATATANCTPFPITFAGGTGAPTAWTCPGFSAVGAVDVSAVTLNYAADYQFGNPSMTNTVSETFVTSTPGGITWSAGTSTTVTVTGTFSSGSCAPAPCNPRVNVASGGNLGTAASLATFAGGFTGTAASSVTSGSVSSSTGSVQVTYTYDTSATSVPEPLSMLLFGGGLLVISLIGRNKFKR